MSREVHVRFSESARVKFPRATRLEPPLTVQFGERNLNSLTTEEILSFLTDVNQRANRKLTLRIPKSGKKREIVLIPQKIADRLKEYITGKAIGPDQRIFPISYTAAREIVNKAGRWLGST